MKINPRSLRLPLSILFYVLEKKEKLSPSNYQVYKLWTNPKDDKLAVYLLAVKYYKVGTPEEWLQFIDSISKVIKGQDIQDSEAVYTLVKSLLWRDTLQVFQNKETVQKERDGPAFTKCLGAVTEHIFPNEAYKIQKKYIQNIHKPLML
eukprot:8848323-Ditylum_brightwellii.AAC.1